MKALRILLVEDDVLIGLLLGEMLSGMGYDVCGIEATEHDAVNAAGRHAPDLMIVDAWLDDGSGVSAMMRILKTGYIPHIFVTGDTASVLAIRPSAIVIQKPFFESDLTQGIERALHAAWAA